MFSKIVHLTEVVVEAWRVSRVPPDARIFSALESFTAASSQPRPGLDRYLADHPARGRIEIVRDWHQDASNGEFRLSYANSIFAPGCLRLRPVPDPLGVLVFLPGHRMGADEVLSDGNRPKNLARFASQHGLVLACWDWPLQGARLNGCLYTGLGSIHSAEREYSRILPALGICLWREYVAELAFALAQLRRAPVPALPMHVVGWSMGAAFAYLAPLLGVDLAGTTAVGSCARLADLLAAGATRQHGHFFYPLNGAAYFDLDDIVEDVLRRGHRLHVVYGDRDAGCLEASRHSLEAAAARAGGGLQVDVLANHGHVFSEEVRHRIAGVVAPADAA